MQNAKLSLTIAGLAGLAACGGSSSSSGTGTFPDFSALALETTPNFTSSLNAVALTANPDFSVTSRLGLFSFPSNSYNDSTDWSAATTTTSDLVGTVFLNAGTSGTVKSMFVVIAQAQSRMADINSNYSDSSGNPTNCTSVAATATLTVPFFGSATNAAFNAWTDTGKYSCSVTTDSGGLILFGRSAIASPTAGCTDAFEYYVLEGYSQDDATNTSEPGTRGATVDISSMSRYYYNGCSKDLKINYAQATKYSGGMEFSSRTELTGNTTDHTFTMRIAYVDGDSTSGSFTSFLGNGQSKKSASSTADANFILGYSRSNCTTASSSSCTMSSEKNFCVKNATTSAGSYAIDSTTTNCASLETTYTGLTPLVNSDLPHAYFSVSSSIVGL